MTDSNLILLLATFAGGLLAGILLTLLFNKVRSGSATPASVKREMENYQQQVEAHFDETSDKFKAMAEQYKDLYEHLSVGATSLCRPEHVVPGLSQASDPLQETRKKIESKPADAQVSNTDASVDKASEDKRSNDKASSGKTSSNKASSNKASSNKASSNKASSKKPSSEKAAAKTSDQSAANTKPKANQAAASIKTKEDKALTQAAKNKATNNQSEAQKKKP